MAFVHDAIDPDALREAYGIDGAYEITVYDGEFPGEDEPWFVTAVVEDARGESREFDLTKDEHADLREVIEQEAEAHGETVKFVIAIPPRKWVVYGTSMVVEAHTVDEAVDRAQDSSGWEWDAKEDRR